MPKPQKPAMSRIASRISPPAGLGDRPRTTSPAKPASADAVQAFATGFAPSRQARVAMLRRLAPKVRGQESVAFNPNASGRKAGKRSGWF